MFFIWLFDTPFLSLCIIKKIKDMNAIEFKNELENALNEFTFPLFVTKRDMNGPAYQKGVWYNKSGLAQLLTNKIIEKLGGLDSWLQEYDYPDQGICFIEDDEMGFTINDDLYYAWPSENS